MPSLACRPSSFCTATFSQAKLGELVSTSMWAPSLCSCFQARTLGRIGIETNDKQQPSPKALRSRVRNYQSTIGYLFNPVYTCPIQFWELKSESVVFKFHSEVTAGDVDDCVHYPWWMALPFGFGDVRSTLLSVLLWQRSAPNASHSGTSHSRPKLRSLGGYSTRWNSIRHDLAETGE